MKKLLLIAAMFCIAQTVFAQSPHGDSLPKPAPPAVTESADCGNPFQDDKFEAIIYRVTDADTYEIKYRGDIIAIRLRMPDPYDTVDTFDSHNHRRAEMQARRLGISVQEVEHLSHKATIFAQNLLVGKRVTLRRYADQNWFPKQWSYGRLLRGVELDGENITHRLRSNRLTLESQ